MRQGQGLDRCGEVPGQERRLGDLNPGWTRTLTALVARIAAVQIGSTWTNIGRSGVNTPELQLKLQL